MSIWDSIMKKITRGPAFPSPVVPPKENFIEKVFIEGRERDFAELLNTLLNFTVVTMDDWQTLAPLKTKNWDKYTFYAVEWFGKNRVKIFEAIERNSQNPIASLLAVDFLLWYDSDNENLQRRLLDKAEKVDVSTVRGICSDLLKRIYIRSCKMEKV